MAAVGRLRAEYARIGCANYARRTRAPFSPTLVEVPDVRRRKQGRPATWRAQEADALRRSLPKNALIVTLDERGVAWPSRRLARWLGERRDDSVRDVAFLIGGPDGIDPPLLAEAKLTLSLGPMTLPHELARLVLLEQIYRAAEILAGSPYHRD